MMLPQLSAKLASSGKFFYVSILIISLFASSLNHREKNFLFKEVVVVHNSQVNACLLSHTNERPNYSGIGIAEITSLLGNLL